MKHQNSNRMNTLQGKVQTVVSKLKKSGTVCRLVREKTSKKEVSLNVQDSSGSIVASFKEEDAVMSYEEIKKAISSGFEQEEGITV